MYRCKDDFAKRLECLCEREGCLSPEVMVLKDGVVAVVRTALTASILRYDQRRGAFVPAQRYMYGKYGD